MCRSGTSRGEGTLCVGQVHFNRGEGTLCVGQVHLGVKEPCV